MVKYHVNPGTGKAGVCRASTKPCPLLSQFDAEDVKHFEDKNDAVAFGETLMERDFGADAENITKNSTLNTLKNEEPLGVFPETLHDTLLNGTDALILTEKLSDDTYDNITALGFTRAMTRFPAYPGSDRTYSIPDFVSNPRQLTRWSQVSAEEYEDNIHNDYFDENGEPVRHAPQRIMRIKGNHAKRAFDPESSMKHQIGDKHEIPDVDIDTVINAPVDSSAFVTDTDSGEYLKQWDDTALRHVDGVRTLNYARESNTFAKNLTPQQNNAIAWWTGGGSGHVGSMVYKNGFLFEEAKGLDVDNYITTVNTAIHTSTSSPKVVYRGIREETAGIEQSDDLYEGQQRFIKQHRVGDEMTFDIPQSTTTRPNTARSFASMTDTVYVIKSKTNAPVGTISAYGLNEEEYLLPCDVKYKVTGIREKEVKGNNTTFIEMEEV